MIATIHHRCDNSTEEPQVVQINDRTEWLETDSLDIPTGRIVLGQRFRRLVLHSHRKAPPTRHPSAHFAVNLDGARRVLQAVEQLAVAVQATNRVRKKTSQPTRVFGFGL